MMVRIINISSGKGGVGKTTVAANLGIALKKHFNKVAVIDFNITTSHLGIYFDIFSSRITLNNFLRNEAKIEDAIYTHNSGLDVVPASLRVNDIVNVDVSNLKQKLKEAFRDYDIVLLDSAPGLGREALIALQASDEVIFVANPHIPSIVDIEKCLQVIERINSGPRPIGIVLNRVRNKNYELTNDEVRQFLNLPIIGIIPEDEEILASFNKSVLVAASKKKTNAKKAFLKLAAKLSGSKYEYGFWERFKRAFKKDNI